MFEIERAFVLKLIIAWYSRVDRQRGCYRIHSHNLRSESQVFGNRFTA